MTSNAQDIDWADEDAGPECGWLQEPGSARHGCTLPAGHFGKCSPAARESVGNYS